MKNIAVILVALLFGCGNGPNNQPANLAIKTAMQAQEDAWNRGDLNGFMQAYWHSDSLVFIGKRGLTYGWQQTLANYQKGYPNRAAMGQLKFTNKQIKPLAEDAYWVVGRWQLYRKTDTLSGHYTLVWKLIDGKWKIVSDHSS